MKKIIRQTDEKLGIIQVTISDERWYSRQTTDPVTKLPTTIFVPSMRWIASHYPKGVGFYKWVADKGWDEAQAIKVAAGNKGSKVHQDQKKLFTKSILLLQRLEVGLHVRESGEAQVGLHQLLLLVGRQVELEILGRPDVPR